MPVFPPRQPVLGRAERDWRVTSKLSRFTAVVALIGAALIGCTTVPLNQEKPVTRAQTPPSPTRLQTVARNFDPKRPVDHSSFVPLADGHEGLGARLRLIETAEHTLDLQYFLAKPDLAGALVAQALFQAADRGVRVRFLLDDVFTTVDDELLGLLGAHPNIELRIFNPSMRPGPKALGFLTEFSRINRRMHNKSFTADGAFSIIGGRNIADEYYQIDTTSEFADFDLLVFGPAVAQIEAAFDLFWNDGWSVPVNRLGRDPSPADLKDARDSLNTLLEPARDAYDRAVNDPYLMRLSAGGEKVYSGKGTVVTDTPAKLKVPVPDGERILAENLLSRLGNAQNDVVILTPYFVPEDYGALLFAELAQRGVRVRIITNSLDSTNHAYVHAGYRRHRHSLLDAGVGLYEVRHDALQVLGQVPDGDETGFTMHTKLAIIDGQDVFVGSLNFDPRSIKQNSEFGFFVNSRPFARDLLSAIDKGIGDHTYRLGKTKDGRLLWIYDGSREQSATTKEPGATVWKSIVVGVTGLLGVELQL